MESLKCLMQSPTAQIFTEKYKSVQPTIRSDAPPKQSCAILHNFQRKAVNKS